MDYGLLKGLAMTPMLISIVAFVFVSAIVGVVAFVLRDYGSTGAAERLDMLVGKGPKADPTADIMKKSAFENDKKSLLELITPNMPSLHKIFEQADCHIKASTLTGIGLVLGVLGGTGSWLAHVPWFFAPLVGLVFFTVPLLWVVNKRRVRLKKFA